MELTDRQRRIIDAKHEYGNNGGSIRSIASVHQISFSALQRAVKTNVTPFSIVAASKGRGRKQRLCMDEEKLIADAVLEFQHNRTPLNLAMTFIKTLPAERRQSIGFKDDRPGLVRSIFKTF